MYALQRLLFLTLPFALFLGPLKAASPYQEELLMQLITAEPGSVIEMPAGRFDFDTQLSLTVDHVTLKGKGMGQTILSFKNQTEGAEGLIVTGNGVVLEDFRIEDTKGDAIKVVRSDGVVMRHLRVAWTRGPATENGAYGLYPVQSRNILIEGCVVSGASDAGIYVGQSQNVIIRRSEAFDNVAGFEVENSIGVDVYHNYAHNNTGGVLVFNLPDLAQKGRRTRVFGNTVVGNNTVNFAPPSNTVADVPTGTGMMITANKQVEIFDNFVTNHQTSGLILASYLITQRPINDPHYNPYVEGAFIYENTFINNGYDPIGGSSTTTQQMIGVLVQVIGLPFPDILYDGSIDPVHGEGPLPPQSKICIANNHKVRFVDLDYDNGLQGLSRSLEPFQCRHPLLPQIELLRL